MGRIRIIWMIYKKLLKTMIKYAPSVQIRIVLLRLCGYEIGKEVYIGDDLIVVDDLDSRGKLNIGHRVSIAPRVTLIIHSRPDKSRIRETAPTAEGAIVIESDAWVGAGAILLPGIKIGKGAVVGAGSVVTRDVASYTVVVGVPARPLKTIG